MSYNRRSYFKRVHKIQQIAALHYEPGNHRRSLKAVWRKYIYPEYGLCYRTFLTYCHTELPEHFNSEWDLKEIRDNAQLTLF